MHIEEIILDGFKSYATRTVVSGFDPRFNAITGLNGSGKSNVLDAICFVLGITNLSQVRANNLQELVYKQGQAGVTKASVTIVFNNKDTQASPVGYEQYEQISVARQVVIGGRNKYLINGHTAQVSQVQNLFHSVQLNVNNPHFLIMQGRITKVLNMKPIEILSMIEEAAGTRMYENKKQAAIKTMMKKEKKVEEINTVLANEITPTLEKLRAEKTHYLQWAANNTEMERLERFSIAFEYQKAQDGLVHSAQYVEKMQEQLEELKQQENLIMNEMKNIEDQMDALKQEKEKEMGKEYQTLKDMVEKIAKEQVKYTAKVKHSYSAIEKHVKTGKAIQVQCSDAEQNTKNLENKVERIKKKVEETIQLYQTKENESNEYQRQIEALNAGMAQDSDSDESLAERLVSKQREQQECNTTITQLAMKLKHIESNIKQKRQQLQKTKTNNNSMDQDRDEKVRELDNLRLDVNQLNDRFNPNEERRLRDELSHLDDQIRQCERDVDDCSSSLSSRLDFKYSDPYRDFDREKVKGVLANLMETKEDWSALALEIVAGNKLYQIVVDNEKTAKDILKFGRLMNRVTIIPLNRVSNRTIDPRKVEKAKHLAHQQGGRVWEALELIDFRHDVRPAMEYAFGMTLICENSDLAQKTTFHKDIKVRTVTLQGDSYDPAGTLQGGSAPSQGTPMLLKLHQLLSKTRKLSDLKRAYQECRHALDSMQQDAERFRRLTQQIELKEHELRLLEDRISGSAFAQLERELKEAEAQYNDDKEALTSKKDSVKDLTKEVKSLESDIQSLKQSRHSRIGVLEDRFKKAKADAQKAGAQLKKVQQNLSELGLELDSAKEEWETAKQSLLRCEEEISELKTEATKVEEKLAEIQQSHDDAFQRLEARKSQLNLCDDQLARLAEMQNALATKKGALEIERKKVDHKVSRLAKDENDAKALVRKLDNSHPWIENEKQFFGREHTDYDFRRRDPSAANRRLLELKEAQSVLSKKINKKVMGMIEKAEQEYQGLMNKRQIIENDKEKITSVIKELDAKKIEALQATWVKVTKDFGSIFSTLLPGTSAKLEPPSNGTIMDGLHVRVAFGGVWKESLTELSGGQRSLLALSLILALLLFKPAPMYILDEVDAALDLSHTQNIGQMIRTHFAHSQFIVVSLKEGMFNNANVIFRTKFVDGVSQVTRTVPSKSR